MGSDVADGDIAFKHCQSNPKQFGVTFRVRLFSVSRLDSGNDLRLR